MPVGHEQQQPPRTARATRVQRTSSSSGPRARPGCTRYQWPSSMASVTAPRNAAPTRNRATASQAGPPASSAGGDEADGADDRRDQVERRRELGGVGVDARAAPGRCRSWPPPGPCAARPAPRWPDTPGLAPHDDTTSATPAASGDAGRGQRRAPAAARYRMPTTRRPSAMTQVDAPHAASRSRGRPHGDGSSPRGRAGRRSPTAAGPRRRRGRSPAGRARRTAQASTATRPWSALVERARALVGGHHDVLEAGAPATGQVDARLDRERVAGHERLGRCPRRCRGPRAPRRRCRGRCGG